MTISLGSWVVPVSMSIICMYLMFRDSKNSNYLDAAFQLLWIIPLLLTWVVYFAILLVIR